MNFRNIKQLMMLYSNMRRWPAILCPDRSRWNFEDSKMKPYPTADGFNFVVRMLEVA